MTDSMPPARQATEDGQVIVAPDLAPLAWELMQAAEQEYGPVEWKNGLMIGGIVFCGINGSVRFLEEKAAAIILLPLAGAECIDLASFVLAHELIHCLYLEQPAVPPMIEEGAAVRFSIMAPVFQTPGYADYLREWHLTEPAAANYAEALLAVEQLLEINPEAIRILRREDPNWRAITPERIRAVAPGVSDQLAATLCEVRQMRPDDECELAAQRAAPGRL